MKIYFLEDIEANGKIMKKDLIHNVGIQWGQKLVDEGKALSLPDKSMKELYKDLAHYRQLAAKHRAGEEVEMKEDTSSFLDKYFNK